jgi:DNA-binding NarL/FixJ family response regulator
MQTIGVLIIDDHPTVRLGLEAILNRFDDIKVLATAESGQTGIQRYRECHPGVVLVDVYMPGMDGIETIAALTRDFPECRAIALTQAQDEKTIVRAIGAGALGYLVKSAEVITIAAAIRAAAAGQRWLSPEVLEAIIRVKTTPPPPDTELTDREREILSLMVRGLKNPQIAENTHISVSTVKFHIGIIFKKLGVQTRTEAVVRALEKGLVSPSD